MRFPDDDYTPYGYLANPAGRATSWQDLQGGTLRTAVDAVGIGWSYPWDRRPEAVVELIARLTVGERSYVSRDDWAQLGLHSAYHTVKRLTFNWSAAEVAGEWRLMLADGDTLVGIVALRNDAPFSRSLRLDLLARATRQEDTPVVEAAADGWRVLAGDPAPVHHVRVLDDEGVAGERIHDEADGWGPTSAAAGFGWTWALAAGQVVQVAVALSRSDDAGCVVDWRLAEAVARSADNQFYATAPRLIGDWPDSWRRGWIYDLETTRLCLRPPGGIFKDVWPAWMIHWPRVVVAEGVLDMLRLGYAAPDLAQRAILTLFRDAAAPNVPCVFEGGEPNMVAKDGSTCGTSPAWCLPFYNVEVLYRWTLDRAWLAELYPYLAAYLRWWLAERTDSEGWIVYRCTWEAGEDNTPRLDPAGEGDHVITDFTRPVELQAMMAVSATILSRLAVELGDSAEQAAWAEVATAYRERTRALWDEAQGRFRDWDKRAHAFVQPVGRPVYWDADPARYSPLSLTPLLENVATSEQARRLGAELPAYDTSPWCDWPSWTYAIVESACAAGYYAFAARMAARIIERVYRRNDRRDLHGYARPLPGVASEYWPTDVATYAGSDGYGWGATTLSLLLRQVIGFSESEETSHWACYLTPGLPDVLLRPGHVYCLRGMTYRGRRLDIAYRVGPERTLTVRLCFKDPVTLAIELVAGPDGARAVPVAFARHPPVREHTFSVERGYRYHVMLTTRE